MTLLKAKATTSKENACIENLIKIAPHTKIVCGAICY